MKIDRGAAPQAHAAYRSASEPVQKDAQPAQSNGVKPQRPDLADISPAGRHYAQALNAVQTAPENRDALVASLKAQVDNGTYTVDEQSLANHIIRHVDIRA